MKWLQLLSVCWCFSILAVTSCIKVDGYSCVSAYWNTVSCILNITGNPVGQSSTSYSLKFSDCWNPRGGEVSCPLAVTNHSYSCDYGFEPSQNIQLTPPHEAEVQEAPETFNITWKSGYEEHRYLISVLDYELVLQTSQGSDRKTLHPNSHEFTSIRKSHLKPDATYCIKVRSIPRNNYEGTWSKWSPSTCWKTEAGEEQDNTLVILIKSLGSVPLVVAVLLFVFCSHAARMKIKAVSHTPSPAPFFQPLFQQHEGNLQKWLSPQGKSVVTYKTEFLKTDAVIVVPKPVTEDPEENQDFHNPPVTQLVFPQCQTSYVGLPGSHEACQPLTMICPGDTSYTQLPCSVWEVGIGEEEEEEEEVASTPPKDFFNISRSDSGCPCEDPTQSPECSLPNSPVDDSPPPCYCNDYCILNKTAEGFTPVLVSN